MKIKKFQPFFEALTVSLFFYCIHKLLFYLGVNNSKFENFTLSIEFIYMFFTICSLVIVAVLLFVKQKSKDNVGNIFMLITCIKAGLSFLLLKQIINSGSENIEIEKINFFVIFALFLALETVITIRILNNNQQTTL